VINAAWTQDPHIPQISKDGHTIWRQIPIEDHTMILEGCPDDTVYGLMDLTAIHCFQRMQSGYLLMYTE
jgi:hypothetical protein